MVQKNYSADLVDFIAKNPTAFHVVSGMADILENAGYTRLLESEKWELRPEGRYYVTRNGSSLMAFQLPKTDFSGWMIAASHSDAPQLKLKENPEMKDENYTRLNVEVYGGALLAPWFDRPLSIAGRLIVETEKGIETRLVNIDRDLVVIPSLAIHMNREANKGYHYNPQKDLLPLFGTADAGTVKAIAARKAGVDPRSILGSDLFVYNRQAPAFWGAGSEYFSSPRLDDNQCAYASLMGFLESTPTQSVPVYALFDNEEVGSSTKQGAASTFLKDTLIRINESLGRSREDYNRALAQSFMISADNAHAVHPNYPEKCDPIHHPVMGKGVVIKYSANQKYTTDGVSAAVCRKLCEKAGIPHQIFFNRSDMPGGSTLGNISGNQVAVSTVDVGLAQLAMHSPYETASPADTDALVGLTQQLFSSSIKETAPGCFEIV